MIPPQMSVDLRIFTSFPAVPARRGCNPSEKVGRGNPGPRFRTATPSSVAEQRDPGDKCFVGITRHAQQRRCRRSATVKKNLLTLFIRVRKKSVISRQWGCGSRGTHFREENNNKLITNQKSHLWLRVKGWWIEPCGEFLRATCHLWCSDKRVFVLRKKKKRKKRRKERDIKNRSGMLAEIGMLGWSPISRGPESKPEGPSRAAGPGPVISAMTAAGPRGFYPDEGSARRKIDEKGRKMDYFC